jgi:hypothetical protein
MQSSKTPYQIDGANSYDPVGKHSARMFRAFRSLGSLKVGTKTHLFKINWRNSPVILDLQSHVVHWQSHDY